MATPCSKQLYKGTSNESVIRQKWKDSLDNEVVTYICLLDVRGSVHRSINYIEITNKMQLFTRIYYSNVY